MKGAAITNTVAGQMKRPVYRVVGLRLTIDEATALGIALDHEDRTEPNQQVTQLLKNVRRRLALAKAKQCNETAGVLNNFDS